MGVALVGEQRALHEWVLMGCEHHGQALPVVAIAVYDVPGHRVRVHVDDQENPGTNQKHKVEPIGSWIRVLYLPSIQKEECEDVPAGRKPRGEPQPTGTYLGCFLW